MNFDSKFKFRIMGGHTVSDVLNDNFDIEVTLVNGDRYIGTIFTLPNVATIMDRHKKSGESSRGDFFWASDMVIVKYLEHQTIGNTINGLIEEGVLAIAFSKVS